MLEAGADGLKLFPAEANPPKVLKAVRAVLPKRRADHAGGIDQRGEMGEYWAAGANGFGLGSALYKVGNTAEQVGKSAAKFKKAIESLVSATA